MDTATWYCVDAARERHGPLEASEIRRRFAAGELHRRSLVWRQGMAQWLPLEQVADELGVSIASGVPAADEGGVAPPAAPSVITAEAPAYVRDPTPVTDAATTDSAMAQAYAASARDASATRAAIHGDDVVDAGFLRRLAALMIDGLLLGVATYAIVFVLLLIVGVGVGSFQTMFEASATGEPPSGPLLVVFIVGFYVLPFVMRWAYYTFFTSSSWQGTPGKRAVGIKVVDLEGRRLSTGRATGRWFAAALSYLTLYIGFLMAAFTDRKQALHDLVAGTRVVDQWAYTAFPERQQRGVGGCAIAALVGLGLFFVLFVVGILAAVSLPAYQDYTSRSKLADVMLERYAMQAAVEDFRFNTDRCPASLEEAGLSAPGSALVLDTELGEIGPGQCSIRFELGGADAGEFDGEYLWFTLGEDGAWTCGGSMADRLLPPECRG